MTVSFVVAVKDSALDAFSRPFFVPSLNVAMRSFGDEVNREHQDNAMWNHAEDYSLYELGSWDESSGKFENLDSPRLLVRAKDVSRKGA